MLISTFVMFDYILYKIMDVILTDDYSIGDVNVEMIDSVIPDYYEDDWDQLSDDEKYDFVTEIRSKIMESFEETYDY